MTAKQPQAGEWWQKEDTRLCIVGTKKNGVTVGETECGDLIPFMLIHDWQHLPDCDSFEWQPEVWPDPGEGWELLPRGTVVENGDHYLAPSGVWLATGAVGFKAGSNEAPSFYRRKIKPAEVFPQYWTANNTEDYAYTERIAKDELWLVRKNGVKDGPWLWRVEDEETKTQLTKEQAKALVDKPQTPVVCSMCGLSPAIKGTAGCKDCTEFALNAVRAPVESPDDWVTQDRVPPRHGIDQVQWSDWESSRWIYAGGDWHLPEVHGYRDEEDDTVLSVRCRRKDLPPVESPDDWVTQDRVPVRLSDEIQWSGMASVWHKVLKQGDVFRNELKHGSVTQDRGTLSVRCRRKDLPSVESPKRVPVRLIGRRSGDVRWQELDESLDAHDREIKHDGYKFYFEEQP